MAPQGQLTASALQALVKDGTFTGSWTLDPARSEVLLETRHTWGLLPLHGVFRQAAASAVVTEAGQAWSSGAPTRPTGGARSSRSSPARPP